jgi:RibD C-terminal domain
MIRSYVRVQTILVSQAFCRSPQVGCLDNDLVDEINLLIVPVVLGQSARLFPVAGPDIALDLVDSRADSKGVTIQFYRPAGRPQYATD